MKTFIRSAYVLVEKEIRSEFRTRYALNALMMFVITTLSIILFSFGGETVPTDVLCGLLWIVIFFSAMSGLSRTFVAEEERGTVMTLQLMTHSSTVLTGKLVYNCLLALALNLFIGLAYQIIVPDFTVRTQSIYWTTIVLGSLGLAVASTLLAAIIAKANTKGTLYPVLAFPILLPILLTAIKATKQAADGAFFAEVLQEFQIMLAFAVAYVALSTVVFEYIWND
ncbi:MAG TPA: heme exporter protein CcmB [Bacteroidota bacterium]|nr:heme exporter protein CcmB [Bacteroidota bacterium]